MSSLDDPARKVLSLLPRALSKEIEFQPTFEGVAFAWLYRDAVSGSSAALLRYQPGARVPPHRHTGYEHIYVLEGSQRDEAGVYSAGTLIVNSPGTSHWVESPDGCLVLAIWQTPVEFLEE